MTRNRTDIYVGPAIEKLKELPSRSVHCIVTSPPYWGLRKYKGDSGMIGLEPTWEQHVENLLAVFRECRRVLRDDGTLWVNYGDCYSSSEHRIEGIPSKNLLMMPARFAIAMQEDRWLLRSEIIWHKPNPMPSSAADRPTDAHEKMFLFSKRPRYFYDAVAVRTGLAESTVERFGPAGRPDFRTGRFEDGTRPDTVFSGRTDKQRGHGRRHAGFNDRWDAMTKAEQRAGGANMRNVWEADKYAGKNPDRNDRGKPEVAPRGPASLRNVWKIATSGYKDAHFATYPPKLIEPCVKAGTSEKGCCSSCGAPVVRVVAKSGGMTGQLWHDHADDMGRGNRPLDKRAKELTDYKVETEKWRKTCRCRAAIAPCRVLDPFGGSGTTAVVANRLGRDAVLIEISPEYADLARRRLAEEAG